jgi:hypothetical protein
MAAVETVFATRRRLIDRDIGFGAQNSSDRQDLAFGCALQGENIAVFTLDLGEFVFSCWLVAGENAACLKRHADSQNCENNGSHNVTSIWRPVSCILAQKRTSRNDLMTHLAMLDEGKEDREILSGFA